MKKCKGVIAIIMMCVMMLTACGKEEYDTEYLKEINVLPEDGTTCFSDVHAENTTEVATSNDAGAATGNCATTELVENTTEGSEVQGEQLIMQEDGITSVEIIMEGELTDYNEREGGIVDLTTEDYSTTLEGAASSIEDIDISPGVEITQKYNDILDGVYHGGGEATVTVGNSEY